MMIKITRDLRGAIKEARDQGARPTCLAFAASDAHALECQNPELFSPEFTFFHSVKRRSPMDPDRGVSMNLIVDSVREDGQPLENQWPYLQALPSSISLWRPPSDVGNLYHHQFIQVKPNVSRAWLSIGNGHPVLIGFRTSQQFYRPSTDAIIRDLAADNDVGAHAVVAVGIGELAGERLVLVRNSWGKDWGLEGHIWLTEGYLSKRLLAMTLTEKGAI